MSIHYRYVSTGLDKCAVGALCFNHLAINHSVTETPKRRGSRATSLFSHSLAEPNIPPSTTCLILANDVGRRLDQKDTESRALRSPVIVEEARPIFINIVGAYFSRVALADHVVDEFAGRLCTVAG